MTIQTEVASPLSPASSRFELTGEERGLLAKERFEGEDRRALARLYDPFAKAYFAYTARERSERFKKDNLSLLERS